VKVRLLLADDHAILREGLRNLLEQQQGFEVIAEAANGRVAISLAKKHRPDVVIMDISMAEMHGVEATRRIIAEVPGVKVIALSVHGDKRYVTSMLAAGAMGYLRKDCVSVELTRAVATVMRGQVYISPTVPSGAASHPSELSPDGNVARDSTLTPKEREIVQLIAEGKSSKEISGLLFISAKTVDKHREHIAAKLGLHSTAELTKYAIREGMTSLDD
jgi:DNA-binding NarL/FixJ family response regulator